MNIKIRRYKNSEGKKVALYIFTDAKGVEQLYVVDKEDKIEALSGEQAAKTLTYHMGQKGFYPDGREELLHIEGPRSTKELGEPPAGKSKIPEGFAGDPPLFLE